MVFPHFRVGLGYDVHRLVAGRRLVLGGVELDFHLGLEGHSDADAVLHAVMDALLGAAALGDIGAHFPPSDPAWRDADSLDLLRRVGRLVAAADYAIGNLDVMVLAEAPRLAPHISAMRMRIAGALDINAEAVAIKATTNERLGFVGRGEGIAAMAVALLWRLPPADGLQPADVIDLRRH